MTLSPVHRALVLFARVPERGRVKTRLAATIGEDAALDAYRRLGACVAESLAASTSDEVQGDGWEVVIACTPDDGEPAIRDWLGGSWRVVGQGAGDLGERMAAAIGGRLTEGAGRVVVVGTDCPSLDRTLVAEAFARLDTCDAVFGPASDGGYYLVGVRGEAARRALPALFAGVPWSTSDTLRASLARAAAHGVSTALLAERRDVDTAADWEAWLGAPDG